MTEPEQTSPPAFSVVRGNPSAEELAAVWAVLASRRQVDRTGTQPPQGSGWSAYWRAVRAPLAPGPGAWRASGRS